MRTLLTPVFGRLSAKFYNKHLIIRSMCTGPFVNPVSKVVSLPILKKKVKPELFYSLEERLREKDEKLQDPDLHKVINIGFPWKLKQSRTNAAQQWMRLKNIKEDGQLEKEAINCTLKIDVKAVEQDWIHGSRPLHVKALAENYAIYKHLYGDYAYFYPTVNMDISYEYDDDTISPVYTGNLLKPKEVSHAPQVEIESKSEDLWTLLLTNPDGNLYDNESEVLHWFVGNIAGGDVKNGEEVVNYIQPFPPRGTGFHRYIFVLYKQDEKLDFSQYRKEKPCLLLNERTFKTYDFYKQFQEKLTPAGLAWFQADWDSSLTDFFHNTLKMREPGYEYEYPKPFIAPQRYFPLRRAFNRYLDLHRDPIETRKLMLLKRLANVHPFKGEKPLLPYPQAVPLNYNDPIWLRNEVKYERDGIGKYRQIYRGDNRPYQFLKKPTQLPIAKLVS